jgi:hypothetical protein
MNHNHTYRNHDSRYKLMYTYIVIGHFSKELVIVYKVSEYQNYIEKQLKLKNNIYIFYPSDINNKLMFNE